MPAPALADLTTIDDAVFVALADPTRRHLIAELLTHDTMTASSLATSLPISRQAVSKHLATLAEARLVTTTRVGRETRYVLTPAPLSELATTLTAIGAAWDRRLERLRAFVLAAAETAPGASSPGEPSSGVTIEATAPSDEP